MTKRKKRVTGEKKNRTGFMRKEKRNEFEFFSFLIGKEKGRESA